VLTLVKILLLVLGAAVASPVVAGVLVWFDVLNTRSKGALGRATRDTASEVAENWISRRLRGKNDSGEASDGGGD
jgi:hypothetical protein